MAYAPLLVCFHKIYHCWFGSLAALLDRPGGIMRRCSEPVLVKKTLVGYYTFLGVGSLRRAKEVVSFTDSGAELELFGEPEYVEEF
jgi:hypothetical protein